MTASQMTAQSGAPGINRLSARIAAEQQGRLLHFGSGSLLAAGGFGWPDDEGRVDTARPAQTWITARMTYAYSPAHLQGWAGAGLLADHGLAALRTLLCEREHGGWFRSAPPPGPGSTGSAATSTPTTRRSC